MQPSRRTFLKTAAASAGALWAHPAHAQATVDVHVHFLGLFVALTYDNKSYIASVKDKTGSHPAHNVVLAIHPRNYRSGGIGELACVSDDVRSFEISKEELFGPTAHVPVSPSSLTAAGDCPASEAEWRNPRWHVKLASIGGLEPKHDWITKVDVKMQVEPGAIEAEPPLNSRVRELTWKVGSTTQALTDRLLYVVKTRNPEFKLDGGGTLLLQPHGSGTIHVYVLMVPKKFEQPPEYKIGCKLKHFEIGHQLLKSGTPIPEAVGNCHDYTKSLVAPDVVTALYECLFSDVRSIPVAERARLLSKTVFCPGYGTYP